MLSKANNIIMATCSKSCLISVKHSSRARAGDTSDSLSSTDVRPLSASGFFFKSFIISSASWLASLVHVRLDSCGPPGGGTATWSWKVQPHPEFVILYQESQELKSASVKCVGVFLMPSVLVVLEESLSSLSQWRAAISEHQYTDDETTDHVPLKSLLLPLACVAVFETKPSPAQSGRHLLELCHAAPRVGSPVFVSATPFASYCPEVFLNSVMSGCVSKLLGSSGSVFLLDASTVPGCEGGMVVHGRCLKGSPNGCDQLCGMVLSSLTSERGQPTGLSLACSSPAIMQALQQVMAVSTSRDTNLKSDFVNRQSCDIACIDELEKWIILLTTAAGWGTGIYLTPSLVLTCSHVVQSKQELMAHNTTIGKATRATVVYSSQLPDLALLKLDKPIGSDHTHVLKSDLRQLTDIMAGDRSSRTIATVCKGMEIVIVGFGLRHGPTNLTGPLVSRGVISKVVYDMNQPVMLVTTAAVNPGMSGGLVASAETGALLGIVISNSQVEDKGTLHPNINYCLPLSWVLPALASYVSDGQLLQMQRLEDWGQKVKHLWQLQSSLDMHPMRSKL